MDGGRTGALKTLLFMAKHCFSWQRRCGGGGEGGVGGVGGESGEGGHGLEPVIKHCFSWQGRWRGGGKCERWGVRAVRAVWAVRAAGVGH